jgi:hypothetical protein
MKKNQKDLTTLLHVFLLDLNHACLSVSTIDRDISHDFPPDVPNTQAAALGMAAGVKPGGGHKNIPAPARVETTRHPHPPPVSGLKFTHTRHPHG